MPTQLSHPDSVVSNNWTDHGASGIYTVASNDGDTTYIGQSFGTHEAIYGMPDLPGPAGSVNSVTEYCYTKRATAVGSQTVSQRYNGTSWAGGFVPNLGSYTLNTSGWSGNLTVAGVNSGTSGVQGYDTAGGENRCTELYRNVDYALAPAGYFFIVGQFLGAAITLAEFAKAVKYFNARELQEYKPWVRSWVTRIKDSEILTGYNDIKAYKHPAFCFQGR